MKITLIAALSQDGFITKGKDPLPGNWTSDEDKQFFARMQKKFNFQVMGSTTYDIFKPKPSPDIFRVILTRTPEKYDSSTIARQMEFKNLTPEEVVRNYSDTHETCLLLGGSQLYSAFIDANLVDEMFITVEPVINHAGVPFLTQGRTITDIQLPAPTITKLNDNGTELHHYKLR